MPRGRGDVVTVREATFRLFRDLGLTTVFGNPGSTEETFLKDFPSDFTYVQTLAEAAAVGAADGFAQATRRPTLVNVHTSAGLSNGMSNILTAFMNRTPLIVTAGNQTRDMLLMEPWLTNIEPSALPKPWVKWSYEPVRAGDVPAAFMRAYAVATQPPQGPVFLSIPLDDWDREADGPAVVRRVANRIAPDPARIAEFAVRLSSASHPALILGASIAREQGWDQAVDFAERLNATVWAAPASERAPFPEHHPLYAGGLPFAIGPLAEKLAGHDVAIVIGAPVFRYYPYVPGPYLPDGLQLLHVSDDPAETAKAPVGDSLLGDPLLTMQALTEIIEARPAPMRTVDVQPHRMAPNAVSPDADREAPEGVLTPLQLFRILREATPPDTVLVEESPSNLAELHAAWPVEVPDTFFTFASGSLGWNLPASVGIALAERTTGRNRPVLAVMGDGSLQYSIQALWTAAQHHAHLIVVVPRNGEYAILKSFAELEETPGVPGLDIPGLDIVSLAKGYGCRGVEADSEDAVRSALAHALEHKGPSVIVVPVTPTVPSLL
ncbi:benzoylformate decarboxylase [Agromyces bracchium]|uniref:Benzoylformate decarboxylase n=1 Tax=Agromyces bracchium TaxID=88376 RepID=A0A6I3M7P4_9MICO|nr:benzoylformate decarboxylase [Agromyces bracchium]